MDPQGIQTAEKRFSKELYDTYIEFRLVKRDDNSILFEGKIFRNLKMSYFS